MKTIELGPVVMVSDPCYDRNIWCQAKIENVLPGEYKVDAEVLDNSQTGNWGTRVSAIGAVHKDYVGNVGQLKWELTSFDIGVDSGQAGIFDEPTYRNDDFVSPILQNTDSAFEPVLREEGDLWYTKMCSLTQSPGEYGTYERGVVSSSGFGDGSYDLWVLKTEDEQVVGFVIDFVINSNGVSFPDFNFYTSGYMDDEEYDYSEDDTDDDEINENDDYVNDVI